MSEQTNTQYVVGAIVKMTKYNRRSSDPYIETGNVHKVWKNGVVEVLLGSSGMRTFNADGWERGRNSRWDSHWQLVGVITMEEVDAIHKAKQDKDRQEREKTRRDAIDRANRIGDWWEKEGQAMWNARTDLEAFAGKTVSIIRFRKGREEYMPFIMVSTAKSFRGDEEVVVSVGGLRADHYKDDECYVNTYSQSDVRGATLIEALYDVTH